MIRLHGFTVDEAAWLIRLSEGRRKKLLSRLAMSDYVLDAHLKRGLIGLKDGIVEITARGIAEVLRLTQLTADSALSATLRSRADSLGARVTPVPPSRKNR